MHLTGLLESPYVRRVANLRLPRLAVRRVGRGYLFGGSWIVWTISCCGGCKNVTIASMVPYARAATSAMTMSRRKSVGTRKPSGRRGPLSSRETTRRARDFTPILACDSPRRVQLRLALPGYHLRPAFLGVTLDRET